MYRIIRVGLVGLCLAATFIFDVNLLVQIAMYIYLMYRVITAEVLEDLAEYMINE